MEALHHNTQAYHNHSRGSPLQYVLDEAQERPCVDIAAVRGVGAEDLLQHHAVVRRREEVAIALYGKHLRRCRGCSGRHDFRDRGTQDDEEIKLAGAVECDCLYV